jgi:hypothetical protein
MPFRRGAVEVMKNLAVIDKMFELCLGFRVSGMLQVTQAPDQQIGFIAWNVWANVETLAYRLQHRTE